MSGVAHTCWRCMAQGIFTPETIYPYMHTHDMPAVPEPVPYVGPPVDIEEQREILRQLGARRAVPEQWQQNHFFGIEDVDNMERRVSLRICTATEYMPSTSSGVIQVMPAPCCASRI
ncbi:hypothetical protein V8E55_006772 [Tylopilus felleus]